MKTVIDASKHLLFKSGLPLDRPSILVLCPTATAAGIIGGQTIESALSMFRSELSSETPVLSFSDEGSLSHQFEHLSVIFIDEISMVGARKFQMMHNRMEHLKGKSAAGPFGGIPVIVTGDFHQLPPVKDRYIFCNNNVNGRPEHLAPNWWKVSFRMCALSEKMRSLEDVDFANVCDSVAKGITNPTVVKYFENRVLQCTYSEDNDNFQSGKIAIIVADNAKADWINNKKVDHLLPLEREYCFIAIDKMKNVDRSAPNLVQVPYTKTGGLKTILKIRTGACVMITMNLDKDDMLTNGQRGFIVSIDEEENIIWLQFPDERIGRKLRILSKIKHVTNKMAVPIKQQKASFSYGCAGSCIRIQRTQFPIVLCYAITSHKCQGMTLGKVLIDFTDVDGKVASIPPGSFYVAITRVRKSDDLYLTTFAKSFIKVNKQIEKEMERLEERATYTFSSVFLDSPVFDTSFNEKELILTFLNINGLLHTRSDLDSDRNLSHTDILCIAETKLSKEVNDNAVQLSNFEILKRVDGCGNHSKGMIIYGNRRTPFNVSDIIIEKFNKGNVEVIHCKVREVNVMFTYVHPSIQWTNMNSFEELCLTSDVTMGDFNINVRDAEGFGKKKLDRLCQTTSKMAVLDNVTYDRYSQPDHVLVDKNFPYPY